MNMDLFNFIIGYEDTEEETLGIGVLFAMILLLGVLSTSYVRQLSRATKTILADNYASLGMRPTCSVRSTTSGRILFRGTTCGRVSPCSSGILRKSMRKGDYLFPQRACGGVERLRHGTGTATRARRPAAHHGVEHGGHPVQSAGVEEQADQVMWWLIVIAALCAVMPECSSCGFPKVIVEADRRMVKKGITEIANHNYDQRLDFFGQ